MWIGIGVAALGLFLVLEYQVTVYRLARGIRRLRELAMEPPAQHRPPGPDDRLPPREQRAMEQTLRALREHGARFLGDLVDLRRDGSPEGTVHWFVAEPPTTCGWAAIAGRPPLRIPAMVLFSRSQDGQYVVTRWAAGDVGHLAGPPSIHRLILPSRLPVEDVLLQHRQLAERVATQPLSPVSDLDGALALRAQMAETHRAWRAGQVPQRLLEADVRSMLPGPAAIYVRGVIGRLSRGA